VVEQIKLRCSSAIYQLGDRACRRRP